MLNEITQYIEDHLDQEIDEKVLAAMLGVNVYTMKSLFNLMCDMPLLEYIRKRRLSNAGCDLSSHSQKVIDVALRYGYQNATSFSRAFEKFHSIKPGIVKKQNCLLKNFPRIIFDETQNLPQAISYKIVQTDEMTLYGNYISTNDPSIRNDAPCFFEKMIKQYAKDGHPDYGMVVYQDRFSQEDYEYWVLWKKKIKGLKIMHLPASKWLVFQVNSQEADEIQEISQQFYLSFLPSCQYNLRNLPDLEYYHDNITEFYIPIA